MGDIVFVELPEVGRNLSKDETLGVIESVNPATGEITTLYGEAPDQEMLTIIRGKIDLRPEGRILDVIAPIYNEPSCSTAACHAHPAEQRVLGVIDVQMPLAAVDELLVESETQMGVGLLIGLTAMLGLAFFLTWRMVLLPVRRFREASTRVAAGDLGAKLPVESSDEIGDLAEAFRGLVNYLKNIAEAAERIFAKYSRLAERRKQAEIEQSALRAQREKMIGSLEAVELTLERSCNDQGHLYGSVTQQDIAAALDAFEAEDELYLCEYFGEVEALLPRADKIRAAAAAVI